MEEGKREEKRLENERKKREREKRERVRRKENADSNRFTYSPLKCEFRL